MAKNDAWLALTQEETLDPGLPICDPHHHLWDGRDARLTPRYLLDEILRDLTSGHNVVSTVFIECGSMYRGEDAMRFIGEVKFANGIAAMSASGLYGKPRVAAGIVGSANLLDDGTAGRVLDGLIAAGNGRLKGIRHGGSWDAADDVNNPRAGPTTPPMPGLFAMDGFRRGFAELAPRGLTFEGWCFHPQIPELTDLARAFPDTTIIFNHFGGPLGIGPYAGRRDEIFMAWQKDVAALAGCPNVVAKLGGINMALNGYGWHE
ncbi:MAG: amidohydrolase family protein, partial [Proteobacteria bacterium]|nr:amidohydrolase family protein [Pseudomonadota bacterium]